MKELPDHWRELGEFIREQRGSARLSLRRLSDLAGISNPYLSQIERGLRKPSAEILQQIARALRISAETLYERAGLLDAHEGHDDTVAAILRDPTLNEDSRQTLLKVYASLRSAPSTAAEGSGAGGSGGPGAGASGGPGGAGAGSGSAGGGPAGGPGAGPGGGAAAAVVSEP